MLPCHRWIPSPDREEIKRHTDDEQRDRKMDDYRVLRVFCKQGSFQVKWVHVVLRSFSNRQLCANRMGDSFLGNPRYRSQP